MYKKYEDHFKKIYEDSTVRFRTFPHHVDVVRHWAERLAEKYKGADRDVVVVAALFHDLGHFVECDTADHAVASEVEARKFLEKEGAPKDFIEKVAHAVRAHRNSDVPPKTLEDRIVIFSDSASHLTAPDVYLYVAARYGKEAALAKLERDIRDLDFFPEEKKELLPLCQAWRDLVSSFPEDFYPFIRAIEDR